MCAFSSGTVSPCTEYSPPSGGSDEGGIFSPNGLYYATVDNGGNNITVFGVSGAALDSGTNYALPSGNSSPQSLAFSPDGNYLVVGGNVITIYEFSAGVPSNGINYIPPGGATSIGALAFSFDDSTYLVARSGNGYVFNFNDGAIDAGVSFSIGSSQSNVAFIPGTHYFVISVSIGSVADNDAISLFDAVACARTDGSGDSTSSASILEGILAAQVISLQYLIL